MTELTRRAATCAVSCGNTSGTAFLVQNNRALTARHCIIDALVASSPITLTFIALSEGASDYSATATVLAEDADLDVCLLSLAPVDDRHAISLNSGLPREGLPWESFGFPEGKPDFGHRINGDIARTLPRLRAKLDIDLSIAPTVALDSYSGMSGSAVALAGDCFAMLRVKHNGSIGAISVRSLKKFLLANEIPVESPKTLASSVELADRSEFQTKLEQNILAEDGAYHFLEGAHGIGKTTFCDNFAPVKRTLACLGSYCILAPYQQTSAIAKGQPDSLYDWLIATISQHLAGTTAPKRSRQYAEMVDEIAGILAELSKVCVAKKEHAVLFIDGINELQAIAPSLLAQFLGLLPRSLPPKVSIILSAPNHTLLNVAIAGRVLQHNVRSVPPLSLTAAQSYCARTLAPGRLSDAAFIADICDRANGHPLYLTYLIRFANESPTLPLTDFPKLSGQIEQYYDAVWHGLSTDDNAIRLLSLISRLRHDLPFVDVTKALSENERAVFSVTVTRLRHLFLRRDHAAIYHSSFKEYVLSKTLHIDVHMHSRLAAFCLTHHDITYCTCNSVYHLLRGTQDDVAKGIAHCDQAWVDSSVLNSSEPDLLLEDLDAVVVAAGTAGKATEVIRLLLMYQRVAFRYNILFARAAPHVAAALISIDRPREALTHILRHNVLIMDVPNALRTAYTLIQRECFDEAARVLALVEQRCINAYSKEYLEIHEFVGIAKAHVFSALLELLLGRENMMRKIEFIQRRNIKLIQATTADEAHKKRLIEELLGVGNGYFITFCDAYQTSEEVEKIYGRMSDDFRMAQIVELILNHLQYAEDYELPITRSCLPSALVDFDKHFRAGAQIPAHQSDFILSGLIRLGASWDLVSSVASKYPPSQPQHAAIRKKNGVDSDRSAVYQSGIRWRVKAFLDSADSCPLPNNMTPSTWLRSFELLGEFIFYSDGRARRAMADRDEALRKSLQDRFEQVLFASLKFSFEERTRWDRSYAIPESIVPFIYELATEVIVECFPDLVDRLLEFMLGRFDDQLGLYNEGFRASIHRVVAFIARYPLSGETKAKLFALLTTLKSFVIRGVENRHELVPELLDLIRLLSKIGAEEEASKTYKEALQFSMGPSWYKEDQFGLLTSALANVSPQENVFRELPRIAGYLDRAAGEMTFQRFVRQEKAELFRQLAMRNRLKSARQYFWAQSCGDLPRLMSEWGSGRLDVPGPRRGNRYPGGAIDEQDAILNFVQMVPMVDWRLRWALLEIVHFGEWRYFEPFARQYGELCNEHPPSSAVSDEIIRRIHLLLLEETPKDYVAKFAAALNSALSDDWRAVLNPVLAKYLAPEVVDPRPVTNPRLSGRAQGAPSELHDDAPMMPGLLGRQSSIARAESQLAEAQHALSLGNTSSARQLLVGALTTIQNGEWSIWERPAQCSKTIEALLRKHAAGASELVALYAPLVSAERHASKWKIADHLSSQLTPLLSTEDRLRVLDHVIEHIGTMIGPATDDIAGFAFLGEEDIRADPVVEVFHFVISFFEHPTWLCREKTADVLVWLLTSSNDYFEAASKIAFGIAAGAAGDVICGLIDVLSEEHPIDTWTRVNNVIDLNNAAVTCKHVLRLSVLLRVCERASRAGSVSATAAHDHIASTFRANGSVRVSTENVGLPDWAQCIKRTWAALEQRGIVTHELLPEVAALLSDAVAPYGIRDVFELERAVSGTFRVPYKWPLNRWEARVRFALNCALFGHVSLEESDDVSEAMSITNPCAPCRSREPSSRPPNGLLWPAMSRLSSFSSVIEDQDSYILHYHGRCEGDDNKTHDVQVIAVTVPTAQRRRGLFLPDLSADFLSTERPKLGGTPMTHEVCHRVSPRFAYFGSFTPAFPTSDIVAMTSEDVDAFTRLNWRLDRSGEEDFGRPAQEGCLLSVKKSALSIPSHKKLAWIIQVDGITKAMIDAEGNELY